MFRIDRAVGASMRTRLTADAKHIVSNQHRALVLLLLQGIDRTGLHTVRVFTTSADQSIGGQLSHRVNPIIIGKVIITTLNRTIWALMGWADIKVDEQSLIIPDCWLWIELPMVHLFSTRSHLEFLVGHEKDQTLRPNIPEIFDLVIGKHRSIVTSIVKSNPAMAAFTNRAWHISLHGEINITVLKTHLW